jgi:hypothetical protein
MRIVYILNGARGGAVVEARVAGSIPDGVSGFSHWHNPLRPHYGPGADSVSNRNKYQEYLLGVKAAGA